MSRLAFLLLALAVTPLAGAADSPEAGASPEGIAAVEEMGRVNGAALACAQPAIVSRARNAVMTGAPKARHYGEAFETATNTAFLAQGKGADCPDGAELSRRLEAAEKHLQAVFAPR